MTFNTSDNTQSGSTTVTAATSAEVVHVGTVMHKGVIGCKPSTPLDEVIRIVADTNVQVLVVTGPDEEALGIISQMDLLEFYGREHKGLKARDVMSGPVIAVPPEMALPDAIKIMQNECISHLVVSERSAGLHRLRVLEHDTGRSWPVPADEAVYTMDLDENPDPASRRLRYTCESLATPLTTWEAP